MPVPPVLAGGVIEGKIESHPWLFGSDADPLMQRTLLGAAFAGILVGLFMARGKCFRMRPVRSARGGGRKGNSRKGVTAPSAKRSKGGAIVQAARGLLVPMPSDKKRAHGEKKAKLRGADSAEEVMALARSGEAAESFEDGLGRALVEGEPSPTYGRNSSALVAPGGRCAAPEPVEDWAARTALDEEFDRIIQKHSTLRAARLAK